MCLDYKLSPRLRETWLKDKPKTITAYKVVRIENGKLWPLYYGSKPFKRKNRIRTVKSKNSARRQIIYYGELELGIPMTKYIAYYHLFVNIKEAQEYEGGECFADKIIICKIPKELITEIGIQERKEVIVTRGFDIVGQDEYLSNKYIRKIRKIDWYKDWKKFLSMDLDNTE